MFSQKSMVSDWPIRSQDKVEIQLTMTKTLYHMGVKLNEP